MLKAFPDREQWASGNLNDMHREANPDPFDDEDDEDDGYSLLDHCNEILENATEICPAPSRNRWAHVTTIPRTSSLPTSVPEPKYCPA